MRPSFSYLDKADAKYREREAANERKSLTQGLPLDGLKVQAQVGFKGADSQQVRLRMVPGYGDVLGGNYFSGLSF